MPVGCPTVVNTKSKKPSPVFKCPPERRATSLKYRWLLQFEDTGKSVCLKTSSRLPCISLGSESFLPLSFFLPSASSSSDGSFSFPVLHGGGYWVVSAVPAGIVPWLVPVCRGQSSRETHFFFASQSDFTTTLLVVALGSVMRITAWLNHKHDC